MKIYIDTADWWIGYYRGPNHHYVCLVPTVVIRWERKKQSSVLDRTPQPPIHEFDPMRQWVSAESARRANGIGD
jgi:hypothetical protein